MNTFEFIRTVINDYRIGAVTKSSRYTVRAVIQKIRPEAKTIVEYGAGEGTLTRKILENMPPQGRLAAIEMNDALLPYLHKIIDSRLTVIKGDVTVLSEHFETFGFADADTVISSIPFTFFTHQKREAIILNTAKNLGKNGQFIVFQYTPLVFPLLKKHFKHVKISYEIRNFFPYFIMVAQQEKIR